MQHSYLLSDLSVSVFNAKTKTGTQPGTYQDSLSFQPGFLQEQSTPWVSVPPSHSFLNPEQPGFPLRFHLQLSYHLLWKLSRATP